MRWSPEVVIEELRSLGLPGADQVNQENFEKFAKKIRKYKREHGAPEEHASEEKRQITHEVKPEVKESISRQPEKASQEKEIEESSRTSRKQVRKQIKEAEREIRVKRAGIPEGAIVQVLPPTFTDDEVKRLSFKELEIDPDRYAYILDFGNKEQFIKFNGKPGIRVHGFHKTLNDHLVAYSQELGDKALEYKMARIFRRVVGKGQSYDEPSDKEKAAKERSLKEAQKRERRAERRKERKKMQVVGKGAKRRAGKAY